MRYGFTLIELLIATAVLAVVLIAGTMSYRGARLRAEVREGRNALAQIFREARAVAQRQNIPVRISFTNTGRPSALIEAESQRERPLAAGLLYHYTKDGVHWYALDRLPKVTYTPPFGETGASSTLFRVRQRRRPQIQACLRIVGVTGRVVLARACP